MNNFENERPLVLVIDDNHQSLNEVADILSKAHFDCCRCASAEEATTAVRTASPDMILCEVNLHGQSGQELYEQIRQQPGLGDVPVMFLSGFQAPDIIRRSHGVCCVRKPFAPAVLVELIDQAIAAPQPAV